MSDRCEFCGSSLAGAPGKGRPRKFCGDACRQAAHRRRATSGAAGAAERSDTAESPPQGAAIDQVPAPAPAPRGLSATRAAGAAASAGDELVCEIAKDIQDGARDLARLLPSISAEEPLQRVVQLQEQLDGLTAAVVGRARYRRLTWATISSILQISEDTARHRYSDRFILRRLARFNRSDPALMSMDRLFGPPAGSAAAAPGTSSSDSDTGGEPGDNADRDGPDQSTPSEPSGAAFNRLSPILSMLIRTAQLTNKEVSSRIGCSASYLSRILSGERVPTWELTRKFAHTCGADPEVLRAVWESEKLSHKSRQASPDPDAPPLPAAEQLRVAVQTLHLRAGRPAPSDIAVASRWVLTAGTVASLLEGTVLPPRDVLENFVSLLGGDVNHFNRLLEKAQYEAAHGADLLQSAPRPAASASPGPPRPWLGAQPPPATPDPAPAGPDAVMKTFSKVLMEDGTMEDGRARLLHKLAKQTPIRDRDRRQPLAAIADSLRQRRLPPATIAPLGET